MAITRQGRSHTKVVASYKNCGDGSNWMTITEFPNAIILADDHAIAHLTPDWDELAMNSRKSLN